jgi:hypothetical protein
MARNCHLSAHAIAKISLTSSYSLDTIARQHQDSNVSPLSKNTATFYVSTAKNKNLIPKKNFL